jgi:PAT family beta-lactamase induction signal transducer AmpG
MRRSHADSTIAGRQCQARNFLRPPAKPVNQRRMADAKPASRSPWAWIPTLYIAEGMPNALVATVSVMLYNDLGVSNEATAFFTSLLYLPWVIKPLWSPAVDILKTRRQWIWAMQLLLGRDAGGRGAGHSRAAFFPVDACFFWLLAFSSATHDIAADGFYMLAPTEREQSFFIGFRSIVFQHRQNLRAGRPGDSRGHPDANTPAIRRSAWSTVLLRSPREFSCLGIYHRFILPRPAIDRPSEVLAVCNNFLGGFFEDVRFSVFSKTKNRPCCFLCCFTGWARRNW